MNEEQQVQIVDLLNEANVALVELAGRLDWDDDEVNAFGSFNRASGAIQSAIAILDPNGSVMARRWNASQQQTNQS